MVLKKNDLVETLRMAEHWRIDVFRPFGIQSVSLDMKNTIKRRFGMTEKASEHCSCREFSEPRLAKLYDVLNPLGADSAFFLRQVRKLAPSSIIDIGCGTGILTRELAKIGHTIIGLDPAAEMLALARQRPCDNVAWINGDATVLPEGDADLAIMTSHVAQFLLDDVSWQETLQSTHDALRSGGHLIFDSRNPLVSPWENWTKKNSLRHMSTGEGQVTSWFQVLGVQGNRVRYEIHYLFAEEDEVISENELVFRTIDELVRSLTDAQFSIERIYGDWDGSLATPLSPEHIVIARRT